MNLQHIVADSVCPCVCPEVRDLAALSPSPTGNPHPRLPELCSCELLGTTLCKIMLMTGGPLLQRSCQHCFKSV